MAKKCGRKSAVSRRPAADRVKRKRIEERRAPPTRRRGSKECLFSDKIPYTTWYGYLISVNNFSNSKLVHYL